MALAKPMKTAAKAQKAVAMKKAQRRSSKVARGRMAKALVLRGSKEKTSGGLRREALMKNKRGKVVSKRASAAGKRSFRYIEAWVDAVMEARKALHISGFVAVNGKTLQGKALYVKSKALRSAGLRSDPAPVAAPKVVEAATPKKISEQAATVGGA